MADFAINFVIFLGTTLSFIGAVGWPAWALCAEERPSVSDWFLWVASVASFVAILALASGDA